MSNAEHAGLTPRLTAQPPHINPFSNLGICQCHRIPSFCPRNRQNPRQPMAQSQLCCHTGIIQSSALVRPYPVCLWFALAAADLILHNILIPPFSQALSVSDNIERIKIVMILQQFQTNLFQNDCSQWTQIQMPVQERQRCHLAFIHQRLGLST